MLKLKRKLYWVAIGLAASQLSIAEYWSGGKSQRFGDCAECGAAKQVDLPVPSSTLAKITGFTHGNGVSGVPNLTNYADQLNAQAAELAKQQAPFVAPKPAALFDMHLYNEILGLRPAERLGLFERGTGGLFSSWYPSPSALPAAPYFSPQGAYGLWMQF